MVVELVPRRLHPVANPTRSSAHGISVAVVGCGYWGSKHVRVLSSLPEVTQIIVVDLDARAPRAIAATYPNVTTAAELSGVLQIGDAVVVATPPRDHFAVA